MHPLESVPEAAQIRHSFWLTSKTVRLKATGFVLYYIKYVAVGMLILVYCQYTRTQIVKIGSKRAYLSPPKAYKNCYGVGVLLQ